MSSVFVGEVAVNASAADTADDTASRIPGAPVPAAVVLLAEAAAEEEAVAVKLEVEASKDEVVSSTLRSSDLYGAEAGASTLFASGASCAETAAEAAECVRVVGAAEDDAAAAAAAVAATGSPPPPITNVRVRGSK